MRFKLISNSIWFRFYRYLFLYFIKYLKMIAANYTEFRKGLKEYLDRVENDHELVIIKRKSGNGAVLISLDEYNSIMETLHLLGSRKNAEKLFKSIEEVRKGRTVEFKPPDE